MTSFVEQELRTFRLSNLKYEIRIFELKKKKLDTRMRNIQSQISHPISPYLLLRDLNDLKDDIESLNDEGDKLTNRAKSLYELYSMNYTL